MAVWGWKETEKKQREERVQTLSKPIWNKLGNWFVLLKKRKKKKKMGEGIYLQL